MITLDLIPEAITYHPPNEPLTIIKALLDVMTVFAFIALLYLVILAAKKYPVIERKKTFRPLMGFSLLGIISMAMDAFDEFFWFSPKEFYDVLWKPSRLFLFLGAIFLLIISFYHFYQFSDRLFGDER
ncbi:MAG: hypothetical protein EAX86_04245 [Candidatus Heimdallarchaeota archaeon]|nr:hypothetical protein [Candidatus Heimdallarchaeota archaeon]